MEAVEIHNVNLRLFAPSLLGLAKRTAVQAELVLEFRNGML